MVYGGRSAVCRVSALYDQIDARRLRMRLNHNVDIEVIRHHRPSYGLGNNSRSPSPRLRVLKKPFPQRYFNGSPYGHPYLRLDPVLYM